LLSAEYNAANVCQLIRAAYTVTRSQHCSLSGEYQYQPHYVAGHEALLLKLAPDVPSLLNSSAGVNTFMTRPLRKRLQAGSAPLEITCDATQARLFAPACL
jgi:hypothetical protein